MATDITAATLAAVIDNKDRRGLKNSYIDMLQKTVLSEVWDIKDAVLLDFGCGTGRFFSATVGAAKRVVGLDINPEMLSRARQFVHTDGLELILFDGSRLPFPENYFDAVMSVGSLQCITDDENFRNLIDQIVVSLRPGGKVYLIEQVRVQKRAWQRTADEYSNAFTNLGCSCIESRPIRNGRSLLLYLIRYGLIPQRWLPALVRREIRNTRQLQPAPWVPYQDYLFVFSKPSR
jgi:ubiquinone/menaquinone biosynthesis C-methylase UbiE